jgi:hypothetical protein
VDGLTIGTVDAENAGTGTGYAAFRVANRNGRINNAYPTNVRVGLVRARGGGRGVFCVSESGGLVIDRVDIANTGNNAILDDPREPVRHQHRVPQQHVGEHEPERLLRPAFQRAAAIRRKNGSCTDCATARNP